MYSQLSIMVSQLNINTPIFLSQLPTHRLVPDIEDLAGQERRLAVDGRHVAGAELLVYPGGGGGPQQRHLAAELGLTPAPSILASSRALLVNWN